MLDDNPLDGKTALVTGGSRGIGRAIVERLANRGAHVVFGFKQNHDGADEVVRAVQQAGGHAHAIQADLAQLSAVEELFSAAEKHLGGLDIVVNNAATAEKNTILDVTEDEFDRVLAVNAKAPFFIIQQAGKRLRDNGRIINISTLNTTLPAPGIALYAGGKAALERFAAVAAREFGARGITVNSVSPGATDTDLLRSNNPPEALEQTVALTAMQRLGQPVDIANVVAFLAGRESQWITGQNLLATGGLLI